MNKKSDLIFGNELDSQTGSIACYHSKYKPYRNHSEYALMTNDFSVEHDIYTMSYAKTPHQALKNDILLYPSLRDLSLNSMGRAI